MRGILLCGVLAMLVLVGMGLAQNRALAFESPVSPVMPEPREAQIFVFPSQSEESKGDDVRYTVEAEQSPHDMCWANVFGARAWPVGERDEAGCQRFSDGSVDCP